VLLVRLCRIWTWLAYRLKSPECKKSGDRQKAGCEIDRAFMGETMQRSDSCFRIPPKSHPSHSSLTILPTCIASVILLSSPAETRLLKTIS